MAALLQAAPAHLSLLGIRNLSRSAPLLSAFRISRSEQPAVAPARSEPSRSEPSRPAWRGGSSTKAQTPFSRKAENGPPSDPLASGMRKMKFGQYAEQSHAEVYDKDHQYCKWVVETVTKGQTDTKDAAIFAAYVQHRWLRLHGEILKKAKPGCLSGQRLVVTGEPEILLRSVLEGLIHVLGGEVIATVPTGSGKQKPATGIVIAGSKLRDGRAVEKSPKLQKAKEAGIKVMTLEELLRVVGITKADLLPQPEK
eukprot:TRINITY_DN78904_c0_g1_i1.p1 TRINITY_DN78904_c0_g1~~TRINITY_DN78904_c0_g1_i1.p1  ORF type:complete len:265 (+),score=45.71 TRINITY_DN78904_c0_g1_i1:35-796(+)